MCQYCGIETSNPRFCSRSHAATYNNTARPKRKQEGICKKCSQTCTKTRSYCKECWGERVKERSIERWNEETLETVKGFGNANAGGRYPYIRTLSRKKYLESDKPKHCVVCGYSLHFDVAHIKDVSSFDVDTPISVVNHIDNLVALCKNHHWEFDNNYLALSS